jgi:signal transduction histidine kinase
MSHELRTPLNAIIGFAEIMESELVGPLGSEQYVGYAKDVRESGQYLLELINDILDLSKIESGQLEVIDETIDLRETIQVCLRMVHDQAAEAKLDIELEGGEKVPNIRANARMIRQILLNLLSNAIKFTPPGGRVTVSLSRAEDTGDVLIGIRDTGIGIARADIERVMRPFEQVASAQADGYRGTGLGLPMAKSLTELHGGVFSIVSEVGSGTTVTIRLPAERTIEAE